MNRINKQGYVEVFVSHCPKLFYYNEWILAHKFVVMKFIGRRLTKDERVHHLNGNKLDNRIENLMLFANQKFHKSFENKIRKDGWTRYRIKEVEERWNDLN